MSRFSLTLLSLLSLAACPLAASAADNLKTVAEQSEFRQTGRYAEVENLCRNFQKNYPKLVRCQEFGRTAEGRPMLALIATRSGVFTGYQAREKQIPVTLIQGGIHAGEIDGKDAGFLALKQVLDNSAAPDALERQILVFVPVFNVDGHERFAAWNRPNQRGPEQTGWRTTAQNVNLNRDYVKADSPEMQSMLRLINQWDPLLTVDLHVTDGAKFEHDISIQVEPVHAGDQELRNSGKVLQQNVMADLSKQGSLPLPFYMDFDKTDDPQSGFTDGVPTPRFSHGYFQLRNRFGMLVETHSWKDYPTRVKITRNTIISVLGQVAANGQLWRQQELAADIRSAGLAGQNVALRYGATEQFRMIDFRGYAYTRKQSDISGALMTRYDESRPQIWHVKLRDTVVPTSQAQLPAGGYLVPPGFARLVIEKLRLHGIQFISLANPLENVEVQRYQTTQANFVPGSIEGHQMLTVQGAWQDARESFGKGSVFVPSAQPKAALLAAILEPQAPDSLLSWGFFNNQFEQKEYMEAYVAEDVAREQLAADPALKQAFEARLKQDPAFAANPAARLEFFARRHPSWDQRYQQYPICKTSLIPKQ